MAEFPYADRFAVNRTPARAGPTRDEVLAELRAMAKQEDASWETGKVLRDDVLRRPRPLRLHERGVRALRPRQRAPARHVPERHPLRGRDHRHDARPASTPTPSPTASRRASSPPAAPAASSTPCSPTASTRPQTRGITRPTSSSPRPATRPSTRPATSSASSCRKAPDRPRRPPRSTSTAVADLIDDQTIAIIGSACNYGYGTIDPIDGARRARPSSGASACTSTAASAASSSRSARSSATTSRCSTSGCPGVTSISADTHKYGYALQGHARSCCSATRRCATASTSSSPTGRAASTARRASRAPAPAACSPRRGRRWCSSAARATCGYAEADLRDRRRHAGRRAVAPRAAASWASPTFCFRFTSDEFDIYHVNDFMRPQGLALQRPAVPERHPHGRHPARRPSPAWSRRSPPTSPTPSPTPTSTRDEQPHSARHLRRRRRRPHRRGRRVHPSRSWPTCSTASWPCPSERPSEQARVTDREEQLVLAIDLGTGGPKVGFVSLTGRVVWQDHVPRRDPVARRRRGAAGRRGVVEAHHRRRPRQAGRRHRRRRPGRRRRHHRAVGEHRARRRGRRARRRLHHVDGQPRRPPTSSSASAGRWRGTRRRRSPPGSGARPASPAATTRSATCWSSRSEHPEVAAAARWYLEPVDYLSMRFTGVAAASPASMTACVAHRQPRPRHARATTTSWSPWPASTRSKLPPLVATGSVIGPVRADVAADLGLPAGVQVVTGTPDLHAAARRLRRRARLARPTWRSARRRGSAARCRSRRPTSSTGSPPCPGLARRVPHRQQPRHRRPVPAVAARPGRRPRRRARAQGRLTFDDLTALAATLAAGRRRRHLHPVAQRRALAGRRRLRPGRLPQPVPRRRPAPTWCGPCSRASPTTTAGCTATSRSSPSTASTPSASSAAAPRRTSGARSTPTCSTARSSGSTSRCTPQLRGVAVLAGLVPRPRRAVRGARPRRGRGHLPARPRHPRGLRPALRRAAPHLQG